MIQIRINGTVAPTPDLNQMSVFSEGNYYLDFLKLKKEEKAPALADFESERVRLHMELKCLRSKEEAAEREKNSAQQQNQLLEDKNENLSKIIEDAENLRVQFERDLELQKAIIDRLQFESKILFKV